MTVLQDGMARPPSGNEKQIALRLPNDWIARADTLIPALSRPGILVSRSDVLRAALARGLDVLEAESRPAKPTKTKR
jgi:hypothetical protein